MGFEGANVLFDSWVHPLTMGLEEHLLGMFRDDFEFADDAAPSHLGSHGGGATRRSEPSLAAVAATGEAPTEPATMPETVAPAPDAHEAGSRWEEEAERELKKIPFFVRGKARRNTEAFARERGVARITVETLYDAKAHYGR
jgi:light-independent protochlorophyllide reductase subunit B